MRGDFAAAMLHDPRIRLPRRADRRARRRREESESANWSRTSQSPTRAPPSSSPPTTSPTSNGRPADHTPSTRQVIYDRAELKAARRVRNEPHAGRHEAARLVLRTLQIDGADGESRGDRRAAARFDRHPHLGRGADPTAPRTDTRSPTSRSPNRRSRTIVGRIYTRGAIPKARSGHSLDVMRRRIRTRVIRLEPTVRFAKEAMASRDLPLRQSSRASHRSRYASTSGADPRLGRALRAQHRVPPALPLHTIVTCARRARC